MFKLRQYTGYFLQSVKNRGLWCTLRMLWYEIYWEVKLGINSRSIENPDESNYRTDAFHHYQGASYRIASQFFQQIPAAFTDAAFYDIGCGKGRILILANYYGFTKISGVEFAPELLEKAKENIARYELNKKVKTSIRLHEADACNFIFPDGKKIFFLFNPFGKQVMERFLANPVFNKQKEEILLIYLNPVFEEIISAGGFKKIFTLKNKTYTEGVIFVK